ncbi:oxidoreductase [Staphylococcus saprophyticus]|uniref:oxidoreductase n=1 Tax=Staphylococcus saprophyticus TaxID=29385 RepID=UPI000852C027|nr:oxidoreductase [Staphylococcus saprophyticus]MDW3852505.1 oxidoreductase [Staphylococcus saprophyticus]MDW3934345.1 oxidoreductase [Staphylococcus saprophyticus]MDW4289713.1 oxidoreductase [Staphylococcus saprophyticus]MDW4292103.1 oxidoreductase [Staphylococcus saprophyticus]MDW4299383.1 oxidoreductase [Staphylococcus saprophyticus]
MNNVAIIGPGAVGSTIAFDLRDASLNVQLLGRRNETLRYHSNNDLHPTYQLDVRALNEYHETVDILFIAVKIPQLDSILTSYQHLLHKNTIIILAQNGHGQLHKFDHPYVYQAVVYISGQKTGNTITHYRDHKLILDQNAHTQALHQCISNSSLNIELTTDIDKAIWYKLLVNLAINSVTALTRSTASVLEVPGIKKLCEQLLLEGINIAKAEHVHFEPNIVNTILNIYDGYPAEMGTSMYYDIVDGRSLEIDGIQGYLFYKARKHHLNTPILDTIYHLLLAQQK